MFGDSRWSTIKIKKAEAYGRKGGKPVDALRTLGCAVALSAVPTALANSSWRWLTTTRPWDLLPFVIAVTLLVEVLAIWLELGRKHLVKAAVSVTVANLLSFAAPYVCEWVTMRFEGATGGGYSFLEHLDRWPIFTVGVVYLMITLVVEVPVVFRVLRADTNRKKHLLLTIILANAATTAFTAFVEHVATRGTW